MKKTKENGENAKVRRAKEQDLSSLKLSEKDNLLKGLLARADASRDEWRRIRNKLLREVEKEPNPQSVELINRLRERKKNAFIEMAKVGEEIRGLRRVIDDSMRSHLTSSYDLKRSFMLSDRLANDKVVKKRTPAIDIKNEREITRCIEDYGIFLCDDCDDGKESVMCTECNGTGQLGKEKVKKEVKFMCLDSSLSCPLCRGLGEYYKEVDVYEAKRCTCKMGVARRRSCRTCSGLGIISTRSPAGKLAASTYMARLTQKTYAKRLLAIKKILKTLP